MHRARTMVSFVVLVPTSMVPVLSVRACGPDSAAPGPILATDVEIRVTGVLVRATVRQSFTNPSQEWARSSRPGGGSGRRGWKTSPPPVTIGPMGSVRFLLILLLTVALDLSTPLPPQQGAETTEEFEESLHEQRGRRIVRQMRETRARAVTREERVGERLRPHHLTPAPVRPAVTIVPIRKLPPSVADPSSVSEDH